MNNSKLYSNFNQCQRHDAKLTIDEFANQLKLNSNGVVSLLDIGCGPGDVLHEFVVPKLPEGNRKIVGVDVSQKMIDFASEACPKEFMEFRQLDFNSDFEECKRKLNQQFDNITSFYCFHWLQNQRQALTNVYNLLKPSGTALLLFLVKNPVYDIYEGLQKMEKYEKYTRDAKNFISPYHHEPEAEKLFRRYISDIGFKPIHIELKDRMFVFETTYQFYNGFKAVNPFMERMPAELLENIQGDVLTIIKEVTENKDVKIDEPMILRYSTIIAVMTK